MTAEVKSMGLNISTVRKKIRCGKIKGRVVVDGCRKRKYVQREDTASPTINLESLLMLQIMEASEDRDVATADIVGSYLLADIKDKVLVKLTGRSIKIICKANERYKNYITTERGKDVIYLTLEEALYGFS